MNPRALFLVASLVANVAFAAAFVLRPTLAPPSVREFFQSRAAREAAAAASDAKAERARSKAAEASARAAILSQTKLWSALQSDDLRALIARLRAAGFPPGVIRAVVGREVDNRFSDRIKALSKEVEDTPYWQPTPNSFNNPKFMEERQQAYRDRSKLMRELLGDQAFAAAGVDPTAMQRMQYGDLPKEKIELLQRINEDYAEMISQVRAATNGIMLPEDRAKLALLEKEKRADLAAILTPQELEAYEMRTSPITSRLRSALTFIDATEDEFRTIYRISLPYADVLYPSSSMGMMTVSTADSRQKREDASREVQAQLKAAFGDARYAELNRAQNYEFQNLARLAQRDNLPMAAAVKAYDLRTSTSEASVRIGDDRALTPDQKLAALRDLAQNTKTQLTTLLGVNGGNSYVQSASWLQAIEKGHVVTFMPDGMGTSFRSISTPTPPPPPR